MSCLSFRRGRNWTQFDTLNVGEMNLQAVKLRADGAINFGGTVAYTT
jgi:hypothetical protein